MRIAALSTNIGWEPGSIVMSSPSYAHAWGSTDASAYAIQLAPGVTPGAWRAQVAPGFGTDSGQSALSVQTAEQRSVRQETLDERALARLTQIATLIPIFAMLAMAAAIGAMVWQRRPRLAKLKLEGLARAQLWRTILFENLLLLGTGCAHRLPFRPLRPAPRRPRACAHDQLPHRPLAQTYCPRSRTSAW